MVRHRPVLQFRIRVIEQNWASLTFTPTVFSFVFTFFLFFHFPSRFAVFLCYLFFVYIYSLRSRSLSPVENDISFGSLGQKKKRLSRQNDSLYSSVTFVISVSLNIFFFYFYFFFDHRKSLVSSMFNLCLKFTILLRKRHVCELT